MSVETESVITRHDFTTGRDLIDNERWPEICEFSGPLLRSRPERIRFIGEFIDIRMDNGRAVYRVTEYNRQWDTYRGVLEYGEKDSDVG